MSSWQNYHFFNGSVRKAKHIIISVMIHRPRASCRWLWIKAARFSKLKDIKLLFYAFDAKVMILIN